MPRLRLRRPPDRFDAMVQRNHLTLLHDGDACLSAMLEAIRAARFEIFLEMYWFASDATGQRFAKALSDKARQGVSVLVIYDAIGSLDADDSMFEDMCAAGCQVLQYNPIAPWRQRFNIGLLNNRDHRKILVCDHTIGFTGGVNIGDPWAPVSLGGEGWRDDMIRIEGLAALSLREVFLWTWKELHGIPPRETPMSEAELRDSGIRLPEGGSAVRVLANHYRYERAAIRLSYLRQIRKAQSNVFITNSYFVPDRQVRKALIGAARRGVDVKVLLPGESDVPAVYYAGRNLYSRLLKGGVELHEWQGTVLHAKTATIDDAWCTVGTYNIDYRSWRSNLEVNVAVDDETIATAMAERFRNDIARSDQLSLEDWRFRPVSERLIERFFYLFRQLL